MKEEYLLNGEVFTLADIESMAEDEGVDTQDIIDGYGFEPKPGSNSTPPSAILEKVDPNILNQRLTIKHVQHIGLDSDGKVNVDELYFNKIAQKRDNGDGIITVEELPRASKTTGKGELRFSHNDEDNALIIKKIKTGNYGYDIKSKQLIKLDTIAKGTHRQQILLHNKQHKARQI